MTRSIALVTVALACVSLGIAAAACSSPSPSSHAQQQCPLPRFGPGSAYHPQVDPSRFGPDVDNPWFPLRPGTTFVYSGSKDGARAVDVFTVSQRTRAIDGVRTRIVQDRLLLDGVLAERTADYYAQDRCGNVWYFGEDTADLDRQGRVVSREGSFHAGVHGGEPGVYMPAQPQLGRRFRQEWSPGNAADQFSAASVDATAAVPYGAFDHALRTRETTDLEPGVLDNKVYVHGVGEVVEVTVKGGHEGLVLVDVLH